MVEAPRIRILYEKVRFTKGKVITGATGASYNARGIDLIGYQIRKWWYAGKYIYVLVIKKNSKTYVIRTHMLMYGKIVMNDDYVNPKLTPFMKLILDDNTKLVWYLSQITIIDPSCDTNKIKSNYNECNGKEAIRQSIKMQQYDISNDHFDQTLMIQHINNNWSKLKYDILSDVLLNQEFFPGIGNISQQEALYRCKVLPTKTLDEAGKYIIKCLVNELKNVINLLYKSYQDKLNGLPHKPILQIYGKAYCPLGHKTVRKYIGYHNRRTTYCTICQS